MLHALNMLSLVILPTLLDSDINLRLIFSTYFDTYMNAPMDIVDLWVKCILVKLPLPGAFNQWLSKNYFTALKDHLPNVQFQWGDIVSNEVLCTVQMSIITVSFYIQ